MLWQIVSVIVVLCTFLMPRTLQAQQATLRFGDVSGSHGETVNIDVFASFNLPIHGANIPFTFDEDRLEFVDHDLRGTAAETINPGVAYSIVPEPGKGFFQFLSFEKNTIQPANDLLLARLKFRIRLDAPVGNTSVAPAPTGPTAGIESRASFERGAKSSVIVEEFVSSVVDVVDCGCPLTVGDLTCEQSLNRVLISFSPSEAYDEIEIRKTSKAGTDQVIAVLPGDANSFTDSLATPVLPELISYTVTAHRDNASSVNATCELTTRNAAPNSISDFTCTDGRLTWTNPNEAYDALLLYKNDDLLTELPANTVEYIDAEFSEEMTIYTLIGELGGFRSAEINCLQNSLTIFEAGDVQVPLGTTQIRVPIYVTSSVPAAGVSIVLDVDQTRLSLVENRDLSLRESEAPNPEGVFIDIGGDGVPSAGILYSAINKTAPPLQPGLRQRIFDFVFDVNGEFTDGEILTLDLADFPVVQNLLSVGFTLHTDVLIDGRLIFGNAGLDGVQNFQAVAERKNTAQKGLVSNTTRNVLLSWRNGEPYDNLLIERNGVVIAELEGSTTDFVDVDLEPGLFTYKVIGQTNELRTFPVTSTVTTVSPPGSFIRGDVDKSGTRDMNDAIDILRYLFLGDILITCNDAADTNDNGDVDFTDAILLFRYLFLGNAIIPPPGTSSPWLDPTPDDLSCGD